MASIPWPLVHQERLALGADLAGITSEQWQKESLCKGWTVHDAVGHMTATHLLTPGKFIGNFIGSGFNFHRMAAKNVAKFAALSDADLLKEFNATAPRTSAPPGPKPTWLGEAVIHAEDVRQPLGIKRAYSADVLTAVLDYVVKTQPLLGAKKRTAGLKLVATDVPWTHGEGAEVKGTAIDLIMASCNRAGAVDRLTGDGVTELKSRTT